MLIISHRGNLSGPEIDLENDPQQILKAIRSGFDVEIDVWYLDSTFYLGHDKPQVSVDTLFLQNKSLWCHAKNIAALNAMLDLGIHCFFHDSDDVTLTSRGWIWTYPGKQVFPNSVIVQKGLEAIPLCYGVCTDYPLSFQD